MRSATISVIARVRARIPDIALLRQGGLAFFMANGVVNVANFGYTLAMSRLLGPATYGALGSIIGVSTAVVLAGGAFQAAVTQAVAEGAGRQAPGSPLALARSLRRSALVGVAAFALMAASAAPLRSFLHLGSVVPVFLLAAFVAFTVATVVPQGVLLGRLNFTTVAVALTAGAAVRLGMGIVLVEAHAGLSGAVAAVTASAAVTLAVLLWPLRHELAWSGEAPFRLKARTAALAVFAVGGVSLFIGTDSFLARHFLSGVDSGYYVAAATGARIALFLPAAIGLMAFPRLVAHGGRGPEARAVLRDAGAAVAVLGTLTAAVIAAVPRPLIDILFGHRYEPAAATMRVLALPAAAVGVVTVGVYALLARRSPLSMVAWAAILAAAVAIAAVHGSPTAVAWVAFVTSAGLLVCTLAAMALPGTAHTGRRAEADATTGGERP